MGAAPQWEPWNWDLWDTPQEPDDDEASRGLYQRKLDEGLSVGREGNKTLADKLL